MNPKNIYSSPALQEDARRFEERLNKAGDISSFGTTVRNKRHARGCLERLGSQLAYASGVLSRLDIYS